MTDEQASQRVVEERLAKLKVSFSASDDLATKLVESNKSLAAAHLEVASLNDQEAGPDMEKVESEKVVAEVRQETERRMVRLNIALDARNLVEKLTRSLLS